MAHPSLEQSTFSPDPDSLLALLLGAQARQAPTLPPLAEQLQQGLSHLRVPSWVDTRGARLEVALTLLQAELQDLLDRPVTLGERRARGQGASGLVLDLTEHKVVVDDTLGRMLRRAERVGGLALNDPLRPVRRAIREALRAPALGLVLEGDPQMGTALVDWAGCVLEPTRQVIAAEQSAARHPGGLWRVFWSPTAAQRHAELERALDAAAAPSPPRLTAPPSPGSSTRPVGFEPLLGDSPALLEALCEAARQARRAAEAPHSPHLVVLLGPTGTGKELLARGIHRHLCLLRGKETLPWVPLSTATLSPHQPAGDLFGVAAGAFTDVRAREGAFDAARGGVLFLDEAGYLSAELQAQLLRALDPGEYAPLGAPSHDRRKMACLLILAGDERLDRLINAPGRVEGLWERQGGVVRMPALAERPEDIPALLTAFCQRRGVVPALAERELRQAQGYPWPGNVRQLKRVVERAADLARDLGERTLRFEHLIWADPTLERVRLLVVGEPGCWPGVQALCAARRLPDGSLRRIRLPDASPRPSALWLQPPAELHAVLHQGLLLVGTAPNSELLRSRNRQVWLRLRGGHAWKGMPADQLVLPSSSTWLSRVHLALVWGEQPRVVFTASLPELSAHVACTERAAELVSGDQLDLSAPELADGVTLTLTPRPGPAGPLQGFELHVRVQDGVLELHARVVPLSPAPGGTRPPRGPDAGDLARFQAYAQQTPFTQLAAQVAAWADPWHTTVLTRRWLAQTSREGIRDALRCPPSAGN